MIRQAIRNTEKIISNLKTKRRIRVFAGMIDAVPGVTAFRFTINDRIYDYEGSTAMIIYQPRLAEQLMIEFIDERKTNG